MLTMTSPIRGNVFLRGLPSDQWTFSEIVKEQVYKEILPRLARCETVIDLGAHIGLASLYFSALYPSCRLFVVEPNPLNYEVLTSNLRELIEGGRCAAVQVAVWGRDAILTAKPLKSPKRYNCFAVRELRPRETCQEPLKGLPMTRILATSGFDTVDILKVDIEGAEVQLFRGDLDWLPRVRAILIEFHENSREECGFDGIMRRHRFRVCDENRHTVLAIRDS